jgi:hypothetical protein
MPEQNFPEKRGFMRTPVDAEMGFRIIGKNDFCRGRCIDLSKIGILLETETVLADDDELSIIVNLGDEKFRPLKARIRVVRVEKTEGGMFLAAGKIMEVD